MISWQSLLDETALAAVLSPAYARFARPVCLGLARFLEQLPAAQQAELLVKQAALPPTATLSQRLGELARGCPVLHKLGQILARDARLAAPLRQQLRSLESLPPSIPTSTIRRLLQQELGPLEPLGIRLGSHAIAEASVGVVIPFDRIETTGGGPSGGVFKVLKPGIEDRLELELGLLDHVGVYLDEECAALQIPQLDYREAFQQVQEKLRWEIRLDEEQRHLRSAATFYADDPRVQIPTVMDHCTRRVTAMERVIGTKVTDHRLDALGDRRELAKRVVQALIARPVFASAPEAMFHCDPHAGNLFWTEDQRLAILDWSLVGSLGQRERVAVVQLLLAAATLDTARILEILTELNERPLQDPSAVADVVRSALARVRAGQLPGLKWMTGLLDQAVQTARLRVAADLLMFRKSLHTLEGVVAEIEPGPFDMDDVLMVEFCRHFVQEWPRRWVSFPHSREFATRLSNLDLAQTMFSWPSTLARYWMGQTAEL